MFYAGHAGNVAGGYAGMIFFIVFLLFGITLVVIGSSGMKDAKKNTWKKTSGVVSNVSSRREKCRRYRPDGSCKSIQGYDNSFDVHWNVNGKKYGPKRMESNTGRKLSEGDTVQLEYDPENPANARKPKLSSGLSIILIVIGALMLFLALLDLICILNSDCRKNLGTAWVYSQIFGGGSGSSMYSFTRTLKNLVS